MCAIYFTTTPTFLVLFAISEGRNARKEIRAEMIEVGEDENDLTSRATTGNIDREAI